MTQREITLLCLRLALSGAASMGEVKDLRSAVNLLLRIVIKDRVEQKEVFQDRIRAPQKGLFTKFIKRVEVAPQSHDRNILDDAELRLECLQMAFGKGYGLRDIAKLQNQVDLYTDIVAGQGNLSATNPGNLKKRAKGARLGSG